MFIINKSLEIAMKTTGKASYADFWRLNPYQKNIEVWRNGENVYVETTYCDIEKIQSHIKAFLATEAATA